MPRPPQLLVQFLRRGGLVLTRSRHPGVRYLDHPPLCALHDVLLRVLRDLHGLRFIQIGANDGRRADPLHDFIFAYGWSGLMFEPLAANFADLQRRHGTNSRLRLRRAAVDLTAGSRVVYDFLPAATAILPDWTRGLGSFSRARLEQAARELGLSGSAIQAETVETRSWEEVWRDFGSQCCDLLVLDTEGYDLTLLRAANLALHRPRIVHFEHACVPSAERLAFYAELLGLGYEIATDGPDTTAWLKT